MGNNKKDNNKASSSQPATVDPNEHAQELAKILNKITQEAQSQADTYRSANRFTQLKDPNVLAQALASGNDPTLMPEEMQDTQENEDEEKPEEPSDNLQKELDNAMKQSIVSSQSENKEPVPLKSEQQDYPDYEPPQGSGEEQESSPARPDEKPEWHGSDDRQPEPEPSWPDAVYDPSNPEGTQVEEGGSAADEPPADWGTYDDNLQSKKPQDKLEEDEKEETWDHDNDPSTPEIVIKGAKFGMKSPKKEDVRTQDVITAFHIDRKRDEKVGVSLSTYNLNYVFAEPDERDHKFSALYGAPDVNYLPSSVDLRPNWGSILDQLDLGSCVSNSVSYAIRYCFRKQKLGEFTPSRLFIYYNGRMTAGYPINEDTGLTIRDGYKSVSQYSVCSENNWPYVPNKFASRPPEPCYVAAQQHKTFRYISLDNSLVQIKKCLKDGFPVSFGTALFESFMSTRVAQTGIIPMPRKGEQRCGGHAMTIIGYDDSKNAFIVVNNWGANWGFGGCCYFPYDYMTNDDWTGDLWSPRYFGA